MQSLRKYLGKLYIPLLWSLVVGVLLCLPGSVLPNEGGFQIPQFDKVVHIGLFGGFVFLWNLYLSTLSLSRKKLLRLFFCVFIIGCTYGISMEFIQKCCIPLRDFDEADIIADMIGAGLAYGFSNILFVSGE